MKHVWISGLKDPEERERMKGMVEGSSVVFEKLQEILDGKIAEARKITVHSYKDGWAYQQAHINGYINAIEEIKKLL
jgi:hypothetical protein